MTGEGSAVPHFPRISAADRADGSVEILAQGESHVFSPLPGRGADDARMRALQHLHEVALGLGRPVRVTTWTLERSRASIVVTPAGDCYDEARPHSSFAIALAPTASSVSPAPDIPAAIRPWGLDLRPAPPIPGAGAKTASGSRRTRWVVAAALAMLLLWSGVVAVLLTTGHQNAAVADAHPTATPSVVAMPTSTPTPSPTAVSHPPSPSATAPVVPPPVVAVAPIAPGSIRITVTRTGATAARPLAMRVRVDPDTGQVFHRLVHLRSAEQSIVVGHLSGGSARWVVLVPGSPMATGRVDVGAPAPTITPTPTLPPGPVDPPSPSTPVDPTPPPTSHPHHATHHHTTHHHSGGTTHHHHHGPSSNPSNPGDPIPGRVTSLD